MTTARLSAALAAAALALAPAAARAYDSNEQQQKEVAQGVHARRAAGLLRMGFDFGGDQLAKVQWSDGGTSTIKAGQLFTLAGGVLFNPDGLWSLETTLGYKFDKVNGSNGSITFSRWPLDVIAAVGNGTHRFGVGPTLHMGTTFDCSASGVCSGKVDLGTNVGAVVQYAFRSGARTPASYGFEAGGRLTVINYKASGISAVDGTGVGFFIGAWF